MARFGDDIRPELGKTDYSGYLQGSAAGSAALGQGIANLGAGAGQFLQQIGEAKKSAKGFEGLLKGLKQLYKDDRESMDALDAIEVQFETSGLAGKAGIARNTAKFLKELGDRADRGLVREGMQQSAEQFKASEGRMARQFGEGLDWEKSKFGYGAYRDLRGDIERGQARDTEESRYREAREDRLDAQRQAREEADRDRTVRKYVAELGLEGDMLGTIFSGGGTIEYKGKTYQLPREQSEFDKAYDKASAGKKAERASEWESKGRFNIKNAIDKIEAIAGKPDEKGEFQIGSLGRDFDTGVANAIGRRVGWGVLKPLMKAQNEAIRSLQQVDLARLKATFGGSQITDSERKALFETTFDPDAGTENNRRLLLEQVRILKKIYLAEELNYRSRGHGELPEGDFGLGPSRMMKRAATTKALEDPATRNQYLRDQLKKKVNEGAPGTIGPQGRSGQSGLNVIPRSRDEIPGFRSRPGARYISHDFNDASNKKARGIEVVVPSDATKDEKAALMDYASSAQKFFAKYGHNVPIRRDKGLKYGGRGKKGVIHLEPFFAADTKAREIIAKNPREYAKILNATLGAIPGATLIAPHERGAQGATSGGMSERQFFLAHVIPGFQ